MASDIATWLSLTHSGVLGIDAWWVVAPLEGHQVGARTLIVKWLLTLYKDVHLNARQGVAETFRGLFPSVQTLERSQQDGWLKAH